MRVLFPGRVLSRHVGGNTTYVRALAERLPSHGIEVGSIPFMKHPAATLLRETAFNLPRHRDAILHYSADTGPLFPGFAKSIATVHGVASRWISVARTPRQEYIWRTRVSRCIKSTNGLITVSNSAADDIAEVFDYDRDNITVIHHGIDISHFDTATELSPEVAERIPNDYVLYVGNIEPRKNLTALIDAFQHSSLLNSGVGLVIAGKPAWNFDSIMQRMSNAPNVTHLGFVSDEDRVALMQRCLLFVFPSLYEGFGFPVLEAMAAGAPVLTSERGSLAEVAGPARRIQELDSTPLSGAIADVLADQAWLDESARTGREWAARFSWDASIDAHIAMYRKVVAA